MFIVKVSNPMEAISEINIFAGKLIIFSFLGKVCVLSYLPNYCPDSHHVYKCTDDKRLGFHPSALC